MRARLILLLLLGCSVDRAGLSVGGDGSVSRDAGRESFDAGDAGGPIDGDDAGVDGGAMPGEDGGVDAGSDAGLDGGTHAGLDAGSSCDGLPAPTREGLVVHYDASVGVTTTPGMDGRLSVVTWLDQSVRLNHALARDVAYEPEGFGVGRPSVRTKGLDESHLELLNPRVDDFTIFVVMRTSYRRNAGNWYDSPCILGGDGAGDVADAALVLSDAKLGFTRQESGHGIRSSGRIDDGMPHVITTSRDGGSGDVVIRLDGSTFADGSSTTGRIEAPTNWWIGAHQDHARGRIDASFAEVRVYERRLSDAERDVVENHLRCQWID